MIQKILEEGEYKFQGDIQALKKCLSSFKVTEVICDGRILGVELMECLGKFRYHGENHIVHISKDWSGKDILYITYRGVQNV